MTTMLDGNDRRAYERETIERELRQVDSDLAMFGCVACNLCVTVCPNDAFFSIRTPPDSDLRGRQQYLVLGELCNECGNCATFCPERGDPAAIKPKLFLAADRFASADGPRLRVDRRDGTLRVTGAELDDQDVQRVESLLNDPSEGAPFPSAAQPGAQQRRVAVNGGRLIGRLDELASIGAIAGTPGCSRLALSNEDRDGRDLVSTWMHDLGLSVRIDGIGNVIATMPGFDGVAPVMTGSHIDTVATGGRYDGNLGVLAGLEVIETVQRLGLQLERPLAVGFFTNEEGARFAPDMLGSLVYVGGLALEAALGTEAVDGAVLGNELARIGYQGGAPCPGPAPHAFVELHIEQGPVLERAGVRLGAVTGVQGIVWNELTITGQS
ncbi:MAG: M20/M25/M40 family metallo-hydrolase, partial [Vibrio fluvialis]